jgi:hypothetical protein
MAAPGRSAAIQSKRERLIVDGRSSTRGCAKTRRYFSFRGVLTSPHPKIIEYSAFCEADFSLDKYRVGLYTATTRRGHGDAPSHLSDKHISRRNCLSQPAE